METKSNTQPLGVNNDVNISSNVRFEQVVVSDWQLEMLCEVLETLNRANWRNLGTALGRSSRELDLIERKAFFQKSLPTLILLKDWQCGVSATVQEMLDALATIGNHTAVLLIHDWLKDTEAAILLALLQYRKFND